MWWTCDVSVWAFDGCGQAYKRNEFGRVDPKGNVDVLTLRVEQGMIVVDPR